MLFKTSYVTEAVEVKAAFALSGVLTHELAVALCSLYPPSCPYISWIPDHVMILLGMMLLDMVTGVMASRTEGGRITSRRLGEGVQRKVAMIAVIAASMLLEELFALHEKSLGGWLYRFTASWFIAVEFLSLYENAARLGLPMPRLLKTAMERLLQKAGQTVVELLPQAETPPAATEETK